MVNCELLSNEQMTPPTTAVQMPAMGGKPLARAIAKQRYEVGGIAATKGADTLTLIAEFPSKLQSINPEIAIIGLTGLLILFGLPFVAARLSWLKKVPSR